MPERKVASTGNRTHNHQVMSQTRSLLSHPGGARKYSRKETHTGIIYYIYPTGLIKQRDSADQRSDCKSFSSYGTERVKKNQYKRAMMALYRSTG